MKVETRGKYPGVKVHLDADEAQLLIDAAAGKLDNVPVKMQVPLNLAWKMGKHIKELLADEPGLLTDRTPEQIAAILAKESEKAALQLAALKKGANWKKLDPSALEAALLKHAK